MATEGEQTDCIRKECCFRYQFTSNGTVFELSVPLKLPHAGNTRELALRLISNHHLPCSLEDDLVQRLEDCIREQSQVVQDAISEDTVYAALKDETVSKKYACIYTCCSATPIFHLVFRLLKIASESG